MNQEPSLKEISSINPDSKFAQVVKMLSSGKGATVDELVELTDWKKHTVRARLSNLRNKYAINLEPTTKPMDLASFSTFWLQNTTSLYSKLHFSRKN